MCYEKQDHASGSDNEKENRFHKEALEPVPAKPGTREDKRERPELERMPANAPLEEAEAD